MTSFLTRVVSSAMLLALAACGRAESPIGDDLLARLPETSNTIVVLNLKAIRQMNGDKPGSMIVAGSVVPPGVDRVVFATHLEPGSLEARKSMGLVQLNKS